MNLQSRRIVLEPAPAAVAQPGELEAFFVGHAPGVAQPARLAEGSSELRITRQLLGGLGFHATLERLDRFVRTGVPPTAQLERQRVTRLFHLPLPVGSPAELLRLFPEAATASCQRVSRLAGERAWLNTALEDFFHAGGRRAWVVVVPEDEGRAAFLPRPQRVLLESPEALLGVELVSLCAAAAWLLVPDLERLQVPARERTPASFEPAPPAPVFLPCAGGDVPVPPEPPEPPPDEPLAHAAVLGRLAGFLAAIRPDMQLLIAPPPAVEPSTGRVVPDALALPALASLPEAMASRVQSLWPYLRSGRSRFASPGGVVAGAIARSARERGAWRSVAGLPLTSDALPFPALTSFEAAELREAHALGVLLLVDGRLQLDDERCRAEAWADSAEVVRFVGDLRRRLTRFGERLAFVVDPDDPRLELGLGRFFTGLHQAGALRGATADAAFQLTRRTLGEGTIAWDIAIAPAYPIDRIVLSFVHTRERASVELGVPEATSIPAEFIPFRFAVFLFSDTEQDPEQLAEKNVDGAVCGAAFSEVSGLEASMQPKKIAEGGRNWGELIRVGATTFNPVTLKRGMTTVNDAYVWFDTVTRLANYGYRMSARIDVRDTRGTQTPPVLSWVLLNVLPTRFKGADLSATAREVAVEELQLTHEGLTLVRRAGPVEE